MNKPVIHAEGLGKQYIIGGPQEKYKTLRDTIADMFTSPARRIARLFRRNRDDQGLVSFWALRNASFEVQQGDVIGVIGRNGAGKSTLLKVLSRITDPTEGYADIRGRVRSLLEVGTGFHPELTGRENITLNGAILGMKRSEIEKKFDEIVAFAEVEKFIDTPVKRYSSGMYLRLAFAVAAHLEPEILLIDEVLAVGDAAFQKKCLGKMGEVAREGRTVLFVSHNMSAVKELCTRGILLDAGHIVFQGTSADCIGEYLKRLEENPTQVELGNKQLALGQVQTHSRAEVGVVAGEPFTVTLPLAADRVRNPMIFFIIEDFLGNTIVHSRVNSRDIGADLIDGRCNIELDIPALWLTPGVYSAYFKFLLPDAGTGTGRAASEKIILEVAGELGNSGKAVLTPKIGWSIESAHEPVRQSSHA
jgi:lipopolysaccharide transport system ATP-binding protein